MNINITTKYNIGDKVYVAGCYYDYYPQQIPHIVTDILIKVDDERIILRYEIEQNGVIEFVPEELMFATYAECTKWCEKQNTNSSILSIDNTK
jgi:hypothetical protein